MRPCCMTLEISHSKLTRMAGDFKLLEILNHIQVHHHFRREWGWQDGSYQKDPHATRSNASLCKALAHRSENCYVAFCCQGTSQTSNGFQDWHTELIDLMLGVSYLAGNETEKTSIEDQVLKSNPILEAFGNVKSQDILHDACCVVGPMLRLRSY